MKRLWIAFNEWADEKWRVPKGRMVWGFIFLLTVGLWVYNWGYHYGHEDTEKAWKEAIPLAIDEAIKEYLAADTLPAVKLPYSTPEERSPVEKYLPGYKSNIDLGWMEKKP
jgi:hypothetical protein